MIQDGWGDVPMLSRAELNENEQRALGGWFDVHDPNPSNYDLLQMEVPLGSQRAAQALGRTIDTDRSREDLLAGRRLPAGFLTRKEITNRAGVGVAAATTYADVVMLTCESEIHIVEIKTANEPIEGAGDAHKAFGQLLMYRDRFVEDYPTLADTHEVHGFVLAEASDIDPTLVRNSFESRGLGLFDPTSGGFLIDPDWIHHEPKP